MFEYRWLEVALDKLATHYVTLDVAQQDRLAAGVESFNLRLATDPFDLGESRGGGYRVAFIPFLMVTFHVNETARRVRVTDVARFGR